MGPVPESVLKKRNRAETWATEKASKALAARKEARAKRNTIFKRAESYVKEYRQVEKDAVRLRREAKAANGFYVEPEAKLAFCVRIRGINHVHPKVRENKP